MLRFSFILVSTFFILSSCASSKYVNYLKQNTETVAASDSLHFTHLDDQFFQNNLFLVGEIHEVATSPRIDFAMFRQINEKVKLDAYLAEMDIAQAYYLKKYLEGSDELSLKEILKEWVVYIGSISSQYREKWEKMRVYYQNLPRDSRFDFVGLDLISDFELTRKLLKEKLPIAFHASIPADDEALISWSENALPSIIDQMANSLTSGELTLLHNIQYNLSNRLKIKSRDKFMYENFKRYHDQNNWQNKKLYGDFGFAHTLQAYNYTFAGRVKKDSSLLLTNKMVSMNALYVDSRLTVQSAALPKFLQDKGQNFTRFKFSYDNRLFMYIKGIADYKKVTKPNTISLIKLDNKNSPYLNSTRGTKTMKLIPIWEAFDIIEGTATTDYAQYVFLVRNADWIIPDKD